MAGKLTGFTQAQIRELWTKPKLDEWLAYFTTKAPDRLWKKENDHLVGLCLWHADTNPSMRFTPGKHLAFCFACQTGRFNLLEFLSELFKQSVDEVFFDLAKRFSIKTDPEIEEILRYETKIQTLKREFVHASSSALQRAANDEDDYAYGSTAVQYLQQRGVNIQQAYATQIGIMPTRGQVYRALSRESQAVVGEYFKDCFVDDPNARGPYGGHLVLPYYVSPQRIGRVKIKEPVRGSNPQWLGPSSRETRGFFGLQMYRMIIGGPRQTHHNEMLVVEGEMDQLTFAQEQVTHHPTDQIPVVCASGGSVEDIAAMSDFGTRKFTLVGDNDAGGNTFVERTLKEATQDRIRELAIFHWPPEFSNFKDPDDVVQGGKYAELRAAVTAPANLRESHQWALGRVIEEKNATRTMTSEQKVDLARKYGSLLKSDIQYDLFKDGAALQLQLKVSLLDKHVVDTSTDVGFLRALQKKIPSEMIPLTFTKNSLKVYGVKTKRMTDIPLNPANAMTMAIQAILGMTIFDWVDHTIGIPDWVGYKTTKQGPIPVELDKQMFTVEKYFVRALDTHAASAKPAKDFAIKRQGLHHIPDTHPSAKAGLDTGEPTERFYFVNGELIFKGIPKRKNMQWEQLAVPQHGAFIFEPDITERWTDNITDVRDFNASGLTPPSEQFHLIREPLTIWRFLEGDIWTHWLAAYIMAVHIMPIFQSLPMVFFTAPSRSGKSTMMQGILSPGMYPHICMLEGTHGYDDYTAAFMQQTSEGSTQLRIWDEFEDPAYAEGQKQREMAKALTYIRNLGTGARRGRGTRTGAAREHTVSYPLMAGGIHVMQRDVDANRFVTIELDHKDGHVAPDAHLISLYGEEHFEKIRRWTTLAPMQDIMRLRALYKELHQKVMADRVIEYESTRMARAMLPVAVMLEWAGQPALEIIEKCIALQEHRLTASSVTPEEGLFRAVFQTNAITLQNFHVKHSLIKLLSDPYSRAMLQQVDVGAYWPMDADYVVLYPSKLPTLLRNNLGYRNMSNVNQIHQTLSRHPLVRSDTAFFMRRPQVLRELQRYIARPEPRELLYVKFEDLDFSSADPVLVEGLDPSEDM